jgi:hypothetical protein
MSQVENPVSAAKQNNCTADDGGHDQDRHVNLQRCLSYATSVHSIRIGASMSAINMFASFSAGIRSVPKLHKDNVPPPRWFHWLAGVIVVAAAIKKGRRG